MVGRRDLDVLSIRAGWKTALEFRITYPAVVAGLVPATPSVRARSKQNRGGRDKPGHDPGEMAGGSI